MANLGPADYNYDETISTLRYANRAKDIKNKAKINEDPKDAMLRQLQKEAEELRKRLEEGGQSASLLIYIDQCQMYILQNLYAMWTESCAFESCISIYSQVWYLILPNTYA